MISALRVLALFSLLASGILPVFQGKALALPEFTRFGYFNCTSCHASPSGGGLLTDYGRSIASERLSTWSYEGEEQFLHGAFKSKPEWFLPGGNIRLLQTYVDTSRVREGRYFPMQRDLEFGVQHGPLWLVFAGGIIRKIENGDTIDKWQARRFFARVDLGESLILRAGRFFPRYGLMTPHHNSMIRRGLGFDQSRETNNAELTWASESWELSLTALFGDKTFPKPDEDVYEEPRGGGFVLSHYLLEKHRIQLSYLNRAELHDVSEQLAGLSGVFNFTEAWHLLSEIDQRVTNDKQEGALVRFRRGLVSYNRLGYEVHKGVVPYVVHEVSFPDLKDGTSRQDTEGLGLNWYPRPHFEIEAQIARVLVRRTYDYATSGYLLFHYYL